MSQSQVSRTAPDRCGERTVAFREMTAAIHHLDAARRSLPSYSCAAVRTPTADGSLTTHADPAGATSTYAYDASRLRSTTITAAGTVVAGRDHTAYGTPSASTRPPAGRSRRTDDACGSDDALGPAREEHESFLLGGV